MKKYVLLLSASLIFSSNTAAHAEADRNYLWSKFTQIGKNAMDRGDLGLSEKMYQEALERAESFKKDDKRYFDSLKNLTNCYFKQRKLSFSEPLYKKMINLVDVMPHYSVAAIEPLTKYSELLSLDKRMNESNKVKTIISRLQAELAAAPAVTAPEEP